MKTSNELGELKLEMKVKFGTIVKPKYYALVDMNNKDYVKIKGISKRLNFLEFNGMLLNPRFVFKKFMKFKESVRRGFIPNEIVQIEKQLSLADNKRKWEKPFDLKGLQDSVPILVTNGKTEFEIKEKADLEIKRKHLNNHITSI